MKNNKIFAKVISVILVVATIFSMSVFSANAATSSAVSNNVSSKLPIVTYASPLSGASRVYSYSDSSLSKKTTGYYIDSFIDQIVIREISGNGKALLVTYPSGRSGYRTRWFAADDILGLSTVRITSGNNAKQKYTVYKMKSSSSLTSCGSVSAGDSFIVLGTHKIGNKTYYPTIYPISKQTLNGVSNVRYKLAMTSSKVVNASKPTTTVKPVVRTSTLTNALYGINISGSKITCGFDGYVELRQKYGYRHEGIDFGYGKGKNVYSLTDGVVVAVVEGSSSKLSTVAVYYAPANKTVVYLHLDPSIGVGTNVSRGTKIGTENSRGAGGVIHTHVEVCNGRVTRANVSKDRTLVNSNPTSFWNSLGYTVK